MNERPPQLVQEETLSYPRDVQRETLLGNVALTLETPDTVSVFVEGYRVLFHLIDGKIKTEILSALDTDTGSIAAEHPRIRLARTLAEELLRNNMQLQGDEDPAAAFADLGHNYGKLKRDAEWQAFLESRRAGTEDDE